MSDTKLHSYFIGVAWFSLSLVSSSMNDVISKYAGLRLHSYEITFFRFMFGSLTLIPFILYNGVATLKTAKPMIHCIRGILLFLAISAWTYGLKIAPVTTATVVSFTVPIFVLIFGVFFLNENIIWQRWIVTVLVFAGLVMTLDPHAINFNPKVLILIIAAMTFAILDIINKKFVIQESMISMLFYSAVIATLFSFPFAYYQWVAPTMQELFLLLILGASANLILFLLLKAFAVIDVTALAPYRYLELIISAIISYIVFLEIPKEATIYGAFIIIPSTLFIIFSEKKQLKTTNNN